MNTDRRDAERRTQAPDPRPRVAVLTTVHKSDDARIFHKECRTLAEVGFEVTLFAQDAREEGSRDRGIKGSSEEIRHSISLSLYPSVPPSPRLSRLPVPRNRWLRIVLSTPLAVAAAIRSRSRTCHLHDPELLPAGLALKALGRQVVYDVHEDYPEQILSKHYLPGWLRFALSRWFGAFEKWSARRFDAVVCATETIAGKFQRAYTVVVRNYPILNAKSGLAVGVSSLRHLTTRPLGHSPVPFRLCHFSGTLTHERGVTAMVWAMDELGDRFELLLAGRFVTPEYEQMVRNLPGFRHVRYLGYVPHEETPAWYAQCDAGLVCLLPLKRYQESLPVKLFEYMAAGLPVVASNFPGFRRIVEDSGCGVCVNPENPIDIAWAVRRLAADEPARRQMATAGVRAVREQYNWQPEGARLVETYRRLAVKGSRLAAYGSQPQAKIQNPESKIPGLAVEEGDVGWQTS